MKNLFKMLRGLFRRRKTGDTSRQSYLTLMEEILHGNFARLGVPGVPVQISALGPGEPADKWKELPRGTLRAVFSGSELPVTLYFFPEETTLSPLMGINKKSNNEQPDHTGPRMKIMADADGALSRLYLLEKDETGSLSGRRGYFTHKNYNQEHKNGLLWICSGYAAYEISVGDLTFYMAVDIARENAVLGLLCTKESLQRVRTEITDHPSQESPESERIDAAIRRPMEFAVGRYILPPAAAYSRFRISSRFESIIAPSAPLAAGDGIVWGRTSLTVQGKDFSWHIGIAAGTSGRLNELVGDPAPLFQHCARETAAELKAGKSALNISSIKGEAATTPDDPTLASAYRFNGRIKINRHEFPFIAVVPVRYLYLLFALYLEPWEYGGLNKSLAGPFPALLSLNLSLLMADPMSVARPFRGERIFLPVRTASMPFFEIMNFADDSDLRLMIQNHLAPRYGGDILKLFRISLPEPDAAPGEDDRPPRIFRVEFDAPRLMMLLPVNIRDEFELTRISIPAPGFDAFNTEVMTGMALAAFSGRLLLSYKMKFLLDGEYLAPLRKEAAEKLSIVKESGAPFTLLRTLKRNRLINAVGSITDADLARVLVARPDEMNFIGMFMTRARQNRLMEDLTVFMRKFEEQSLQAEDIVQSVGRIEEIANRFKMNNR